MAFKKSFNKQGGKPNSRPFNKSAGDKPFNSSDRPAQKFTAVCANCSKKCEVPFRPTSGRSVFCRDCFHHAGDNAQSNRGTSDTTSRAPYKPQPVQSDNRIGEIKLLVEKMESKIDSIVAMLENQSHAVVVPVEKTKKTAKKESKKV
jgi:CxxC-x17-CxxC domain-containing protein